MSEPFDIGKPSKKLVAYISEVEHATGLSVSISPFPGSREDDEFHAVINIGPSITQIEIKYQPLLPLSDRTIEKSVAHELTHALLIYGRGYPHVAAENNVRTRTVQLAANVENLIDNVIVDTMITKRGFPPTTPELLMSFTTNCQFLEAAESRNQLFIPNEEDPIGTEISFVGDYIYAWAMPRYVELESQVIETYRRFRELFRGLMKNEFAKCEGICALIEQNDIFSEEGRTNVVVGALNLWEWEEGIYLAKVSIG